MPKSASDYFALTGMENRIAGIIDDVTRCCKSTLRLDGATTLAREPKVGSNAAPDLLCALLEWANLAAGWRYLAPHWLCMPVSLSLNQQSRRPATRRPATRRPATRRPATRRRRESERRESERREFEQREFERRESERRECERPKSERRGSERRESERRSYDLA